MNKLRLRFGSLSRCGRRPAGGFTLIETIIVVGIMGIMALIAAPWFVRIHQRYQLKSAAFEVQSSLLAARMSAVKRNTQATVTINVAGVGQDSHVVATTYATLPGPGPTPAPGPVVLLPKLRVDFTTTPPGSVITYKPDGTLASPPFPTPGIIVVEGPPGAIAPNQITIESSPSGRVRVITPVNWN